MPAERVERRKLDRIVNRYATSDVPMLEILRDGSAPQTAATQALVSLYECLNRRRLARFAIRAAEAVPIEASHPDLLILVLTAWAEVSCRIRRPSEAEALIQRAKALMSPRTYPEVRAATMVVESILADTTGDKSRRETVLQEALSVLPRESPRRKFCAWELALCLAQQGRGTESESELRSLAQQCNEHFPVSRLLEVRFIDAMETGRLQQASLLVNQIERERPRTRYLAPTGMRGYRQLLQFLLRRADRPESRETPPLPRNTPTWLRVIASLQENDPEEALALARVEAARLLESITGAGIESLNMIRAELAARHGEAARRLLTMRHVRGNRHYLDDFFLARAELLSGSQDRAAHHFAAVLDAVQRADAGGRLNFELELACELSRTDMVTLNSAPRRRKRARKVQPQDLPLGEETTDAPAASDDTMIGQSLQMHHVRTLIAQFAEKDAPVLITGETGTGKELVARALHEKGRGADQPFIAVNCGAITETLLESELFGHTRGAFTGAERAHKGLFMDAGVGTIFLDEIGEIPPRLQHALLRVLETGEIRAVGSTSTQKIRCRIMAATNADLTSLVEQNKFRRDLQFRFQRLGIHIPPLRERKDDILLLARHFFDHGRRSRAHTTLSADLVQTLTAYDWPGNVREVRNVIERMRLMHSDKLAYTLDDLDLKFHAAPAESRDVMLQPGVMPASTGAGRAPHTPRQGGTGAARSVEDVGELLRSGNSPLRRLDRLRELFASYKRLTRSEVVRILGVSPNTASKDLKTLIAEDLIERVEPSASTRSYYFALKQTAEQDEVGVG